MTEGARDYKYYEPEASAAWIPRPSGERGVDSQTLELIGRHRLASELLLAGLEVAFPARDRGIDLIAYLDLGERFIARPIQMKAASARSFGLLQKYEKFPDLILAFVWHLGGGAAPETYAMTYEEAKAVVQEFGWMGTASWRQHGGYGTTRPTAGLRDRLQRHRMTPDAWRVKVASGTTFGPCRSLGE